MTNDKRPESEALNPTVLRWRWHTPAVFSDLDAESGGLLGESKLGVTCGSMADPFSSFPPQEWNPSRLAKCSAIALHPKSWTQSPKNSWVWVQLGDGAEAQCSQGPGLSKPSTRPTEAHTPMHYLKYLVSLQLIIINTYFILRKITCVIERRQIINTKI